MNYSTLQEAYNIDTFEKKSKPSNKSRNPNGSGSGSGGGGGANGAANANTSPAFVETSKLALSSCSPLQAPTYNIPISNDCKREHEEAMNVYTNANNNMTNNMNSIPTSINNTQHFSNGTGNSISASNTGSPNIISNPNNANNLQLTQSLSSQASLLPAQNLFSNSNDNVMPYYDEDLEQYFNISNLNDEVKYNPNNPSSNASSNASSTKYPYMANNNRHSYTNNDTAEYTNNNTLIKNGNNLLNNSSYNLTPEEKKSAEEAMAYLKSIEDKINGGSGATSGYNRNTIADPVAPTVNTGPAGFKTPEKPVSLPAAPQPIVPVAKNESNYIYNAIFNISILLIIGIAIILLCDQIVELSIHIGMKRTINILEPFIKAHAAAAAAQQAAQQAAQAAAQAQTIA